MTSLTKELKKIVASLESENGFFYDEVYDAWLKNNPMPEITDLKDFNQAVTKCLWSLKNEAVATFCHSDGVKVFELNTDTARWAIEQSIINRKEGTMLAAGLAHVANLAEIYG